MNCSLWRGDGGGGGILVAVQVCVVAFLYPGKGCKVILSWRVCFGVGGWGLDRANCECLSRLTLQRFPKTKAAMEEFRQRTQRCGWLWSNNSSCVSRGWIFVFLYQVVIVLNSVFLSGSWCLTKVSWWSLTHRKRCWLNEESSTTWLVTRD